MLFTLFSLYSLTSKTFSREVKQRLSAFLSTVDGQNSTGAHMKESLCLQKEGLA